MKSETIKIGIVMQRKPISSRWQPYQWRPIEILDDLLPPQEGGRCLLDDPNDTRWLFNGFETGFFTDEAEGYFLNISSPAPCWFVMWRIEEIDGAEIAVPKSITLSYNEAARLMDGGEQVDTLPASADVIEAMTAFVNEHYKPEVKKKRRKPSFEGGAAVEQMAKAEVDQPGDRNER
jgi:hypothetical protein